MVKSESPLSNDTMKILRNHKYSIVILVIFFGLIFLRRDLHGTLLRSLDYSVVVFDQNEKLVQITLTKDEKFRLPTNLEKVSKEFLQTTLLYEDKYFYYHMGVNPVSLFRAALSSLFKKTSGGASTITMQLVRLRHSLYTKTVVGKIKQILYAIWYECVYSKNEILAAYLSIAPYGGNVEGVTAASLIYYAKSPELLDYNESVRLAVLPQSPTKRWRESSKKDFDHAIQTAIQRIKLNTTQEQIAPKPFQRMPNQVPNFAKHFVDRIRKFDSRSEFHSTLNLDIQKEVEKLLSSYMNVYKELSVDNASILIVEGREMNVRAYLGSASYTSNEIEGYVNGLNAKRSPGSLLKPFIYALAVEQGIVTDQTTIFDLPIKIASYHPENFERNYLGPLSAADALVKSRNIPALELFRKLEKDSFYNFLNKCEVSDLKTQQHYGLGIVLGGLGITAEEIAQCYGTLAHGGVFKSNTFYKDQESNTYALLSKESTKIVTEMLSKNPPALSNFKPSSIPWKTGTSYGSRDAWAVGYFDNYLIVVWVGNFNNKPNPNLVGRDVAGPILFSLVDMLRSNFYKPKEYFEDSLNIKKVEVCALSGLLPNTHCPHRKESYFIPGVSPIKTCQNHKLIKVNQLTGRRACADCPECEARVAEVWDTVTLELFSKAGLNRSSPPSFEESCTIESSTHAAPIRIISPEPHLEYFIEKHRPLELELFASVNSQSKKVHWFVDSEIVSEGPPSKPGYWRAMPGTYTIRVVDDLGNSARVTIQVKSLD